MRKKFVQIAAVGLLSALFLSITAAGTAAVTDMEPEQVGAPGETVQGDITLDDKLLRVGLNFGSGALEGANLLNETGSGYEFGYYDGENQFVPLAYTAEEEISVVKTENVYYGTYNDYESYHSALTSSAVAVGCYHLQLPGGYATFEEALAVAGGYSNGFVAYIGDTFYARVGNYTQRTGAEQAQLNLQQNGIDTTIVGTSAYGVSVVLRRTNRILFQYDDTGAGTGLGVQPVSEGEKATTWFNKYCWNGGFRYERIDGKDLTVVNMVALGDYLKGVVPYEMSPSWYLEALKAQAVCARTYALSNVNKHSRYHFDICSTTDCQAYHGTARADSHTDRAVDETAGVVATYNGRYASTVYYSSNGGASEDSSVVWGGAQSNYPYLLGVMDPYEELVESKISGYCWTRAYTGDELAAKLREKGYSCSMIVSARVGTYTDTGNPNTVVFTDSQGKNYTLNARAVVTMLGLRSYRYDFVGTGEAGTVIVNEDTVLDQIGGAYAIDGSGNLTILGSDIYVITEDGTTSLPSGGSSVSGSDGAIVISGKGWGHNVGMSQWGAYAMAEQGKTYVEILQFYYTGITVG